MVYMRNYLYKCHVICTLLAAHENPFVCVYLFVSCNKDITVTVYFIRLYFLLNLFIDIPLPMPANCGLTEELFGILL